MNAQELEPEVSRLVQAVMKFKVNLSGEETIDDLHILQMDLATLRASVHPADDLLSKEFDKVRGTLLGEADHRSAHCYPARPKLAVDDARHHVQGVGEADQS